MTADRAVTVASRNGFLVPVALAAGLQVVVLFVFSGAHDELFAWAFRSPLSAASMGAGYCAGLAMLVVALRLRRWADVRLAYVTTLVLLVAMLGVSLVHRRELRLDGGPVFAFFGAWGWLAVHVVASLVGLALLAWQTRAPGTVPPREPRLWLVLAPVCVVAVVGTGVGLAALFAPAATAGVWPWPVSTLDVRALGVWALTFGVGSAWAVWDSDPERQRTGAVSYLVAGVASLVAVARYSGQVDWGGISAWLYVASMGFLVLLGAAGWLMAGPPDRWQPPPLTA